MNINSNDHLFYPYSIKINTCSGSCNNVNDLYANLCVPDVVEVKNVKLFNLMSRTNEERYIGWHQIWNKDKCRFECKELIDRGRWDKGFIWSPSNCKCECDKPCDVSENCKCRNKLFDKLVEECSKILMKMK